MATQPPGAPAGRTRRFTDEQRKAIGQRHRTAMGEAKYGDDLYRQGWRPEKDKGGAFLSGLAVKRERGAFAPLSWDTKYDAAGNLVGIKAKAKQLDRIREFGSDWIDPSKGLSAGHLAALKRTQGNSAHAQRRKAFFDANEGADMGHYAAYKQAQSLPIDPNTGFHINKSGELWNNKGERVDAQGNVIGAFTYGKTIPAGFKGGGGAAGGGMTTAPGGGGGAAGGGGMTTGPAGGQGIEAGLNAGLTEMLNSEGPFNEKVVQNLRNQAKMDAYGPLEGQIRQANEDAAERGVYRSGMPADVARQARESAAARYSQAASGIETNAILQNHQAKLGALDRAQKWLDSKRQWILANETNALNRELGLKQIALGYARIQSEQQALDKSLAQSNYQFNQMNPNITMTDPVTGQPIVLAPGQLKYLDYFTG